MIKLPLYSLVAALYTGAVAEVTIGTLLYSGPRTLPTKSSRGILLMVSEKPVACMFPGNVSMMLAA